MTRVALIASSFLPRVGGVEEHVANAALRLRDLGHDVSIWASDQGDPVPTDYCGIPLTYLPCPMPARSTAAAARFIVDGSRAWAAWRNALRRERPDILHVHCFGPNGMYAMALSRTTGRPLVLSNHGETFMDANRVFEHSALLRWGLKAALRHAAAVTSCSRFAAEDLAQYGADPGSIEVVYNGIDPDEPSAGKLAGLPNRYVLGMGRLVSNKGFDQLIRAFAISAADPAFGDVGLVIGGEGPERPALESLVNSLGLAGRVNLTGRLHRPQVGSAMAGATLLVVPSSVEAFGITILEGWRAGIPVVATRRGGPPEFVRDGDTGFLFDPDDVLGLSEHISRLLSNPGLCTRIGTNAQAAVEAFTWRRVAEQYDSLYRRNAMGTRPTSGRTPA